MRREEALELGRLFRVKPILRFVIVLPFLLSDGRFGVRLGTTRAEEDQSCNDKDKSAFHGRLFYTIHTMETMPATKRRECDDIPLLLPDEPPA